ncbi:MAG: hypothetical protein LBH22_05250 [Bacteroidales bacterium]|nr:hypothetical protein [Bacteroidales bacterium]
MSTALSSLAPNRQLGVRHRFVCSAIKAEFVNKGNNAGTICYTAHWTYYRCSVSQNI